MLGCLSMCLGQQQISEDAAVDVAAVADQREDVATSTPEAHQMLQISGMSKTYNGLYVYDPNQKANGYPTWSKGAMKIYTMKSGRWGLTDKDLSSNHNYSCTEKHEGQMPDNMKWGKLKDSFFWPAPGIKCIQLQETLGGCADQEEGLGSPVTNTEQSDDARAPAALLTGELRFAVGDKVICETDYGWEAGHVVALNYQPPQYQPGQTAPYQVKLEAGPLLFVPVDSDQLCKRPIPTWWEEAFIRTDANLGLEEIRAACQGQNVNISNHEGLTALAGICKLGHPGGVEALLEMRANLHKVDVKEKSILHHATEAGDPDAAHSIIKTLLNARANPNVHDKDTEKAEGFRSRSFKDREEHRTPLHYCAEKGYVQGATVLIEATADPNAIDSQYMTPLHLAIEECGCGEMVRALLRLAADPNKGNMSIGMTTTCLIAAARDGDVELARELITARASLDQCGKQGMTALHMAVRGRHVDFVALLIEAKCDMNIKAAGNTAKELAMAKRMPALAKAFGFEDCAEPLDVTVLSGAQKTELYIE